MSWRATAQLVEQLRATNALPERYTSQLRQVIARELRESERRLAATTAAAQAAR